LHPRFAKSTSAVTGTICNSDGSVVGYDILLTSLYTSSPVPTYAEVQAILAGLATATLLAQIQALGGGFERATAVSITFS